MDECWSTKSTSLPIFEGSRVVQYILNFECLETEIHLISLFILFQGPGN